MHTSTITDMKYLHIGGPLNTQTVEAPGTLTYTPNGYPHIQDADKQYTLVIIGNEEIYAQATWCYRVAKAAWQHHRKEHPR